MDDEKELAAAAGPGAAKSCRKCGMTKLLLDFPVRSDQADGHHWWCFECKRAKDRAYGEVYRAVHPEEKRQNGRKYARKPEVRAARSAQQLWAKYGLTPETFEAKLAAQGGQCPFCLPGAEVPKWDVDHDHACCPTSDTCGQCLRDILCHTHNIGLGYWRDDPDLLRAAADYIESWRAKIVPGERVKYARRGEGHQSWQGDAASPNGKLQRVRKARGSADRCVNREASGCTSTDYEWVLMAAADPGDAESYQPMCRPCHLVYVGSTHSNAVLTLEQAQEARRLHAGGATQKSLCAQFGVMPAVMSNIILGKTYKVA